MHVNEKKGVYKKAIEEKTIFFCSQSCFEFYEKPEFALKNLERLVIFCLIISLPTIYLSFISNSSLKNIYLFVLATFVQFMAGFRFYRGTWDSLKSRSLNSHSLIAVGTSMLWIYSTIAILFPSIFPGRLYFDASVLIITLILTGKLSEEILKARAALPIKKLADLQTKTAKVIMDNEEVEIPIEHVKVGDILVIDPESKIPADGVVIQGNSSVDESMISGNILPVEKKTGDEVIGSTTNKSGLLKVRATKIDGDTVLAQIIKIVNGAKNSGPPIQITVDKFISDFIPFAFVIAVGASIAWFYFGNNAVQLSDYNSILFPLSVFVSVLLIASSRSMGIAMPVTILAESAIAVEEGVLIKSGEVLEKAKNLTTIVFDKTGVLTKGEPEVNKVISFSKANLREVLVFAAIAERGSEHPLGQAIVRKSEKLLLKFPAAKHYQAEPGRGIKCFYLNKNIYAGNRAFMRQNKISTDKTEKIVRSLEAEGNTIVFVGYGTELIGAVALKDDLREHSKEVIDVMKKKGLEVVMVTGDNDRTAGSIGKELGIQKVSAFVLPEEKAMEVKKLQDQKKIVGFVGDGINDALAISQANLGIAIGSGTDVLVEPGGIILIKNDLRDVLTSLDISRLTMRKIKQNLFFSYSYNLIGIPIAAGLLFPIFGFLLSPIIAGALTALSSVFVVGNSLLVKRYKPVLKK